MSGIDVTSMTNEMMTSDYLSLNQLLAKEQTTQWTQDRYRSVISNMNTFNSNYFVPESSKYILNPNAFSIYSASSSNNSVVTATTSNTAQAGTYSITGVTLAKAAQQTGTTSFSNSGTVTNSSAVSTLGLSGVLDFNVNGKDVNYDLTANANQTIGQFMSSLSSQSGENFNYSDLTGKFSVATTGTGASQSLTIDTSTSSSQSNSQSILNSLLGTNLSGTTVPTAEQTLTGGNGSFTITEPNGGSNTVTESSNQFSIDGVNYNFTSDMNNGSQISTANPVTIGVTVDTTNVVNQIQNFVNDYNNLIGGIQDAVNEKKNYSYQPLTTMQESQMTDSQITAWNQQAQQGLLENDDTLNGMLTSMREAFYTPVQTDAAGDTIPLSMADVGLSTSDDPTQGGKLTLDTTKLTAALQSNPQQVINLFSQVSTSDPSYSATLSNSDLSTRNNQEGIFQRLSDITQEYVGTGFNSNGGEGILLNMAGLDSTGNDMSDTNNTLTTQLKQEQTSVTDYLAKMTQDKTRYTTMYTNLQSALSQMNSQQSAISSMLSSSSSSSG
jgi:flagellar hook-associated protein 2